jgi:hypothetical protein
MSPILKGLSATVSLDGYLNLIHRETQEVVESLPIREPEQQDRSYILSTWVKSYAPVARRIRVVAGTAPSIGLESEVYLKEEAKIAEAVWQKGLVLGSKDNGFTIHGWVSGYPGALLHCYIPPELRRQGICKALISHLCGNTLQYARPWPFNHVPSGWTYNPYLLKS